MEDTGKKRKEFIGYEYKEVSCERSKISFFTDGYESFGWEPDENYPENIPSAQKKVTVRLKRNRKIINKMELTRLQRNFEACVNEIDQLEKTKTSAAVIYALLLGIIGTAFIAGSVFAVTAQPPHVALCILLAVPGFIGWILPCIVYKKIVEKQTKKVMPLIEAKYDEMYEICEKGNKLLY